MKGARSRFAVLVALLRFPIVVAWIAAAVAATVLLPSLDEAQTGALGDLVPNDAQAIQAEIASFERFGFPLLSRTLVVQRDRDGLDAGEQARVLARAVAVNRGEAEGLERIAGALPVTNAIGGEILAPERSTTAITYLIFGPEVGRRERERLGDRYVERVASIEAHDVALTGAVPARDAQADAISDALPLVELATVVLVLALVGLHFRALLAPFAVLLSIAVAYLISIRAVAAIGERFGVSVPAEVEPVVVVLLFGVITDYAVFFLSRFRQRLTETHDARAAAVSTVSELQGTILTAGLIVIGASASLAVAHLGFFQAFGPGVAMAVLVALAVSLTLLPALMCIFGSALLWPSRPGRDVPEQVAQEDVSQPSVGRPARSRAMRLASSRPKLTIALAGIPLLAAASGMLELKVGQTLIRGLPADSAPRQAYAAAATGFAPGVLSPTVVVVEGPGIAFLRSAAVRLQRSIEQRSGIAQVVGPAQQPLERNIGAVYSPGGDALRLLIILDSDPLGARAIETITRLRADLPRLLRDAQLPLAQASIAGDTALAGETVDEAGDDLGRIAPVALIAVLIPLIVFLRALIAPLYLLGASILALMASLGLTAYVFQSWAGYAELTFYVPFAAAVLLMALGSDYNVFLAGRIWREARHMPLREAVYVGGSRAARAITVAGLVLALSFALLAIVPVRPFRELAFAMTAGLLIDAFIVRTLLVPALIALVGPAGGWPGRPLGRRRAVRGVRS